MLKGTLINAALIITGTIIGIIFRRFIKEKYQTIIADCRGLFLVYLAITNFNKEVSVLNVVLSLIIGGVIGEFLNLEGNFVKLGNFFQNKFAKNDNNFAKGFVEASLVYAVGSMAILGSIQSGLENNHTTLITKGIMDGVTSIFFAANYGIGVGLSALVILIYQGAITLFSSFFSTITTTTCINHISVVGGIILLSVATNMLGLTKIKSTNITIALIITVIFCYLGI